MKNEIKQIIKESVEIKNKIISDDLILNNISKSIELITDALNNGKKILFCGNGGSAADAQHLAAEFSGRFYKDRKALPAEALHCNTSYLTAVGNDYGFEFIYSRLIEGIWNPGDVLVGISTSGNSKNIINAFSIAKEKQLKVIAVTGEAGGNMKKESDILINVPSTDTPRIQELHILIGHIICQKVESNIFWFL